MNPFVKILISTATTILTGGTVTVDPDDLED